MEGALQSREIASSKATQTWVVFDNVSALFVMNKKFRVAMVQCAITHLQPESNFKKVEEFLQKAKSANAQVIVFPEDFITGSIFGDLHYLDRKGEYRRRFQELAKKYALDIVTGSWMEETPTGVFNTSSYINANGEVLGVYNKNHLYLSERNFLTAGTQVTVFDTAYGKTGIIICWDILFPEIFARMKELSVEIVYCPSYWYKEIAGSGLQHNALAEEQQIDAFCLARAVENNIVFVYVNAAGDMIFPNGTHDTLIGHSQISLPIAGTVAKIENNREEMIVQEVDLSFLQIACQEYQL